MPTESNLRFIVDEPLSAHSCDRVDSCPTPYSCITKGYCEYARAEKLNEEQMIKFLGDLRNHTVNNNPKPQPKPPSPAQEILNQALAEMEDRARTYDNPEGERSMEATVDMFNALTGLDMSYEQGWKFMVCLKLVRTEQGDYRADNYVDGAAYFSLAGEQAAEDSE